MGAQSHSMAASTQLMANALTIAEAQLGICCRTGEGSWLPMQERTALVVSVWWSTPTIKLGTSIVPDAEENPCITPLQQFVRLSAVNEISVQVRESRYEFRLRESSKWSCKFGPVTTTNTLSSTRQPPALLVAAVTTTVSSSGRRNALDGGKSLRYPASSCSY